MTSSWACCNFLVFHCQKHLHSAIYKSQLLTMLLCALPQSTKTKIRKLTWLKNIRSKYLKNCLQFCKRKKKKKEFKNFLIKTRNIFVEFYVHIVISISPFMAKAISNEQVIFCCCYWTRNKLLHVKPLTGGCFVGKISVTSPNVINVPTRASLAVEAKCL